METGNTILFPEKSGVHTKKQWNVSNGTIHCQSLEAPEQMNIINKKSIFTSMLQGGPFAIGDTVPLAHPFSQEAKEWTLSIKEDSLMKTKYRAVRNQIFDFLSISTFDEILSLIHEEKLRELNTATAHQLLGNMFDIRGNA